MSNVEIAEKLEAFASGPAIRSLSTRLNEFNLFEAIGMVNQEIRHSAFLAFLLTPRQSHGLGDQFLKAILRVTGYNQAALDAIDLTETWVVREWHNIDILAVNTGNKLVIVIENKIYTGEHSDQLARYRTVVQHHYPGYQLVCLYLTPHGSIASHPNYISISYFTLTQEIERLALQASSHNKTIVHETMMHYVQILRKQILGDDEIEKLCWDVYRQHKQAIDMIVKHIPSRQTRLQEHAVRLLEQTQGLMLNGKVDIAFVSFLPSSWEDLFPKKTPYRWSPTGHRLLFWFCIEQKNMLCYLQVAGATSEEQKLLLDIALAHFPLLNPEEPKRYYTNLSMQTVLTEEEMDNAPLDMLLDNVTDWWNNFIATDLPAIEQIFINNLQQSTT